MATIQDNNTISCANMSLLPNQLKIAIRFSILTQGSTRTKTHIDASAATGCIISSLHNVAKNFLQKIAL